MMLLIDWLKQMEPSDWAIAGIILVVLEVVLPTSWLLWPGLAALIVALLHWLIPLGWTAQLLTFAALTMLMLVIGRRFYNPANIRSSQPDLNQQVGRHQGKVASLTQDVENGRSRIHLGDSEWQVELPAGETAKAGTQVEITGQRSNTLLVKIVEQKQ
ncbi:NfeD family protein [Neiella sp. HB171785]|uniref:NfeD family protein n=1 Tax=Neiella litorisoli TaxID=2771431 RepID=A0A8J6QMG6_9GAMM|nr:NfeD family protein [Neiella litorisoli]MBD1390881.1 NfeD family protein [Neiella litorisoli]